MENKIRELEEKVSELESQAFNQKLINTFTNVLMIIIGASLTALIKKIGI